LLFDILLFDILLFDILLFDILLFDILLFDILLFDILLFDFLLFDILLFDILLFDFLLFDFLLFDILLFEILSFLSFDILSFDISDFGKKLSHQNDSQRCCLKMRVSLAVKTWQKQTTKKVLQHHSKNSWSQGCQMVYFRNQKFQFDFLVVLRMENVYLMAFWNIVPVYVGQFCTCLGHLVYFVGI
jgi:hypothetical protein